MSNQIHPAQERCSVCRQFYFPGSIANGVCFNCDPPSARMVRAEKTKGKTETMEERNTRLDREDDRKERMKRMSRVFGPDL